MATFDPTSDAENPLKRSLDARYPGLVHSLTSSGGNAEDATQLICFIGSRAEMLRAGLVTGHALSVQPRGAVSTEYGDAAFITIDDQGLVKVAIRSDQTLSLWDITENGSPSAQLKREVAALLRPFITGTHLGRTAKKQRVHRATMPARRPQTINRRRKGKE